MGSKGTVQLPQQQTQTNNVTPNPVALAAYSDLISRAQGVAAAGYQPYGGGLVQGFSPQQQQAFNEVGGLQGAADPYITEGRSMARTGATAGDPTHFGSTINAYMSPYLDSAVAATRANINETNAQQQNNVVGNAIAKGAMGGDRVGVAQAELAREQNLTNNQTIAGMENQGFQNASGNLFQGAQNAAAGAYSMGALGNEAQSTGLQGANALLQTGGLQQQLGQANLSTAYQQFLNQQAYPFQNLSWLSGLINGTGPNMGQSSSGTSQGYTSQLAPNPLNTIAGLGVAGLGLFSDERVKEDVREVGKLNDGQKLYRYRYKGHPEYHVGLIAQEVERRHPDAVGSVDGIKTVDYREATDDAVRAHKAGGGGLSGIPYADFASGGLGGVVGYVPSPPQIAARGLQLPEMPKMQQPGTNSGQAGQDIKLPSADALSKAKGGLGNIGSSVGDFLSADNHDYATDLAGGLSALARGGMVRGYDDGGTVLDDTSGGLGSLIEGRSVDDPYAERRYAQESGGRQFDNAGNPIISPKGATGIAQVMPSTGPEAAGLAGLPWDENRFYNDEKYNKALGDAYYAKQYTDFGDHDKALAAYNAGPGRLRQALASAEENGGDWKSYLPAETQNYVANITGSQDGGLGAISDATNSSGSGLGTMTEGRSVDDGTGETAKGLFDKANVLGLPDNARTALIAAGLGMAASKSHWLGPALGEGGLEGVKAYQTQQKTGIAQQQANQSGENIKSEIATRKGQLGISQQQIEQRAKELGIHLEQVRNQGRNIDSEVANREASQRDIGVIPGVGYRVFDKMHPEKGVQIIPFSGEAGQSPVSTNVPAVPSAPSVPSVSNAPAAASAAPVASASGATPEPPRGASGMMNWKPVTSVPQGFIPENHMNIFTDQKTADREGTIAEKMIEQNRTDAKNAMPILYRLDEMDHAIDNLPKTGFLAQGTGANERANIAKTANTFANAFHLPNIFNESSIASIENMNKDTFRLGAELSRQIGGREPGFIVQQAVQANPGVENTATGYRRIVSGLREAARYQQDRNTFMDDYYAKFHHINGAEDAFAKANPPQKYVDRAVMSTIDPRDAQVLQKHPDQAKAFDGLYGKGSAKLVLGNANQ